MAEAPKVKRGGKRKAARKVAAPKVKAEKVKKVEPAPPLETAFQNDSWRLMVTRDSIHPANSRRMVSYLELTRGDGGSIGIPRASCGGDETLYDLHIWHSDDSMDARECRDCADVIPNLYDWEIAELAEMLPVLIAAAQQRHLLPEDLTRPKPYNAEGWTMPQSTATPEVEIRTAKTITVEVAGRHGARIEITQDMPAAPADECQLYDVVYCRDGNDEGAYRLRGFALYDFRELATLIPAIIPLLEASEAGRGWAMPKTQTHARKRTPIAQRTVAKGYVPIPATGDIMLPGFVRTCIVDFRAHIKKHHPGQTVPGWLDLPEWCEVFDETPRVKRGSIPADRIASAMLEVYRLAGGDLRARTMRYRLLYEVGLPMYRDAVECVLHGGGLEMGSMPEVVDALIPLEEVRQLHGEPWTARKSKAKKTA
jgi:hypothetical protein